MLALRVPFWCAAIGMVAAAVGGIDWLCYANAAWAGYWSTRIERAKAAAKS